MAVRMSQVKSVCTANEVSLVLASRKPQLETLSPAELKRSARRARALFDKWQGLARGQARARSQKEGFGEELPSYQVSFTLYENGVTNNLVMDYGDYALSGSIKTIEALAPSTCASP